MTDDTDALEAARADPARTENELDDLLRQETIEALRARVSGLTDRNAALRRDTALALEAGIGAKVKRLREARGWSQADLAERFKRVADFDFHQTTVAKMEAGKRPLRVAELVALAYVFSMPPAAFFYLDFPDESEDLAVLDRMLRLVDEAAEKSRRQTLEAIEVSVSNQIQLATQRGDLVRRMSEVRGDGEHPEEA